MIRNLIKFVIILGLVCTFIGGGVAALYGVFQGRIERRDEQVKAEAIRAVVPAGARVDVEKPLVGEKFAPDAVYAVRDAEGKIVAYVAQGEAQGYSSVVKVMVGAVPDGDRLKVHRVVVLSQQETPGLGATVAEERSNYTLWEKFFGPSEAGKTEKLINPFLDRFRDRKQNEIQKVDGITAATITSNATKRAVEQALERIREALKERPAPAKR